MTTLAALIALLLPFLVALGLPLRLARLAFLLVLLEGAARPTVPLAFAAAVVTTIVTAIPVAIPTATAAALAAVAAAFAAAPLSSLAHGRSFR